MRGDLESDEMSYSEDVDSSYKNGDRLPENLKQAEEIGPSVFPYSSFSFYSDNPPLPFFPCQCFPPSIYIYIYLFGWFRPFTFSGQRLPEAWARTPYSLTKRTGMRCLTKTSVISRTTSSAGPASLNIIHQFVPSHCYFHASSPWKCFP